MVAARKSPSTRTLGNQLVMMSTVEALIAYICLTFRAPMTDMETSKKATTTVILVRMEYLASMFGISQLNAFGASVLIEPWDEERRGNACWHLTRTVLR